MNLSNIFGKKTHEYKILQANSLINEEQLNNLSKEGWRLIEIAVIEFTYYFYFERSN